MIRAKKICKSYPSTGEALHVLVDINLDIAPGEFVAIVGKSGSGKTTLLSLLAALDKPTSGEIYINNKRIDTLSENDLAPLRRKSFGFIFQSYHLIPTLTAVANVMLPSQLAGLDDSYSRATELLQFVGLEKRLTHLPSQLSGGEQQRVAICRSLINDPDILFADEPTGNLDASHSDQVIDLLLSMRGKKTLVLVTHDMKLAQRADRMVTIHNGRIQNESNTQNRIA